MRKKKTTSSPWQPRQVLIDYVDIDVECSHYVVLGTDRILVFASQHELRVEDQVEREEAGSEGRVQNVQHFAPPDQRNYAEDHENEAEHKQVHSKASEVNLCLKSKNGQAYDDHSCDRQCYEYCVCFVLGRDAADQQRLKQCEHHEQNHVEGKFSVN
ncbi:hypothetical protein BpHYR1_027214 [Brachionus plicatilis]|uniref:Uncharacterized protein n=1 Tax=Brachionus plicatilis TaxID=10195 RepID=A0A3M7T825_BRAPC|nr:hypothetical protein BpHYR1_027214 [Brachionus plicatilis]